MESVEMPVYYRLSGSAVELPSFKENLPDMMDSFVDSIEKLAEGNVGLAVAKLAAACLRPILPVKNDETLMWKLLIRSALSAWLCFASWVDRQGLDKFRLKQEWNKRKLKEKTKARFRDLGAYTIDSEFFETPGESEVAECFLEILCESLQSVAEKNEDIVNEFQEAWPRYFSNAVEVEYAEHLDEYSLLFDKLSTPMATYNRYLKIKHRYYKELLQWESEKVFGENVHNEDIYIHLEARSETAKWLSYQYDNMPDVIDLDQYLMQWGLGEVTLSVPGSWEDTWELQFRKVIGGNQRFFIIHGEPGSGKSMVLKHFAMCLVKKHLIPIFISLKEVPFAQYSGNNIEALRDYIQSNFPWVKKTLFQGYTSAQDTIIILDGLDEITGDVWGQAQKIIQDLDQCSWNNHTKVLISGRTQLITACTKNLENAQIYQICPLEEPLQQKLWEKLQIVFSLTLRCDEVKAHLHLRELFDKPLLMFLIAWLQKNGNESILSIRTTSDLYNKIIDCLYYRRHSGKFLNPAGYQNYRTVLAMLGRSAQKSNSNIASIRVVKAYAKLTDRETLFNDWINANSLTTSKLLLAFFGVADERSMVLSFYHRSFVEFLAIEDISNWLIRLPWEQSNWQEGVKELNQMFKDYCLFDGENGNIKDFWLGRLDSLVKDRDKFSSLIRVLSTALTYINKSELSDSSRQNILKAIAILFEFLADRQMDMQFEPQSTLKDISAFRSKTIPCFVIQRKTYVEYCDFSQVKMAGLILQSPVILSDCYFNAAKLERINTIKDGKAEEFSGHSIQLHKLQFYSAELRSVDITDAQIKECRFDGAKFSWNQWQHVSANNVSFKYAFLKESMFSHIDLYEGDFSCLNLPRVAVNNSAMIFMMTDSRVFRSHFDYADLRQGKFINVTMQNSTFRCAKLANSKWEKVSLQQVDFSGIEADGIPDVDNTGIGKNAFRMELRNADLQECHFDSATLRNCDLSYARMKEVSFKNARLTNANFVGTKLYGVNFENADLSHAEFSRTIVFEDCVMEATKLEGVSMANFDLSNPDIIQMLSKADLYGVNWDGVEEYRGYFESL